MYHQYYPSLRSWIIAALVFLFLLGVVHVLALRYNDEIQRKKQRAEATYLLRHVVEQLNQEKEKTQVVVLGSSLVGQGVACAEEMKDTAFKNIVLSKIFVNTHLGVIETFTSAKVFDSLVQHPPDMVLIELDQLTYRIEQEETIESIVYKGAFFLKNLKTASAYDVANYRMPEYCGKIIDKVIVDTVMSNDVTWQPHSFDGHAAVHSYLARLRQAGVKVIIIHIPRPAAVDSTLHSASKEKELLVVLDQYKQKYQMDYWHYPELLPFSYFYDQGHLNKKGRMHYSAWLYSNIEKEIQ